jgi:hypothetical protein
MKDGKKIHYLEAKAMTETKINKETVKNEEEYLPLPFIDKDPAYVTVTAGVTKNLGSFNSAKISISIHYPCDPNKVDEVYLKLKNWVDKRVGAEVAEIQEYIDSQKVSI